MCSLRCARPHRERRGHLTNVQLRTSDEELFATVRRELFTCVVGDVMDKLKVRVNPGEIMFGDVDDVLVVPAEAEEEVFTRALEKV